MKIYLGIDGGQSSTTALIGDETGRVLGYGTGGPCNHVIGPEAHDRFLSAVATCMQEACQRAGLDFQRTEFTSACLGFSGGAEDKEALARKLIRSQRFKITHDAEIALAGATASEPGIVVIAGTGSMAFGRNSQGKTGRAGGWGHIIGDEGGAFDIAKRAIRAALQFEEGWGSATDLTRLLLAATKSQNANQLLHEIYGVHSRQTVAGLARLVSDAAGQGDLVALNILQSSANSLAWIAQGVYQQLFQRPVEVPVAYVGGVFHSETLVTSFSIIVKDSIGCPVSAPKFPPAAGALLEAWRADGKTALPIGVPEELK